MTMLGKLKRTVNKTENGIGLGLHVSKKLVEMYDGCLKIDSQTGKDYSTIVQFSMQFKEFEIVDEQAEALQEDKKS